jgi:DUF4097 and DUF4098 domain-containing protein YvlB
VNSATTLTSVSGDINSNSITGSLTASTTSGDISVLNCNGDIKFNTTSGELSLTRVKGKIVAKSLSGSINGQEVTFTGESSFHSQSGDVFIASTNPEQNLSFNLKSFSGRLNAKGIIGKDKLVVEKGEILINGQTFSGNQTYK